MRGTWRVPVSDGGVPRSRVQQLPALTTASPSLWLGAVCDHAWSTCKEVADVHATGTCSALLALPSKRNLRERRRCIMHKFGVML